MLFKNLQTKRRQKLNNDKIILSLFDYTGNWSKPYRDAGFEVIQVDIKLGFDIFKFDYKNLKNVYGILAAVPCTDYAVSGARWFAAKDKDGRTDKSNLLVKKTMEIINYFKPTFWVIENPISRIHKLNPGVGKAKFYFHPFEFAHLIENPVEEQYSKKTALYGKFISPVKGFLPCLDREKIHKPKILNEFGKQYGYHTEEVKAARQITPQGFAKAFYESNK
jgi:hypothetical protein